MGFRARGKARISPQCAAITILIVIVTGLLPARQMRAAEFQDPSNGNTIAKYWPIDAPSRHWSLFESAAPANATAAALSISNESLGAGKFILWYTNPERELAGTSNGEEFRYCNSMGRAWIFFDEYLSGKGAGHWASRPVKSSRIILTLDGGKSVDLIADGTYAGCGSNGQPYLFSSDAVGKYRLQVWGYLANNPKYKWYWDAIVSKPTPITNTCMHPPQTVKAMKVQEAWWSNFAALNGKKNDGGWTAGSSGKLGEDGVPDGSEVKDFRTVWHAEGQIPYYSTGSPDGTKVRRCINRMPSGDN
jgi:hypothetical protein